MKETYGRWNHYEQHLGTGLVKVSSKNSQSLWKKRSRVAKIEGQLLVFFNIDMQTNLTGEEQKLMCFSNYIHNRLCR